MKIRVAVGQFHDLSEERLRFAAQIGATGLQMNNPTLHGETRWEEADVRALVGRVEAHGLKFEAIENVPVHFYDKVMTGAPGRDEQIENYIATMRAVARAGIPVLGYHFMPNSVWTTSRDAVTRGGRHGPPVRFGRGQGGGRRCRCPQGVHPQGPRAAVGDAHVRQGRTLHLGGNVVGELRLLHQGGTAGRRRGRPAARAPSRRSAGAYAGWRGAAVHRCLSR